MLEFILSLDFILILEDDRSLEVVQNLDQEVLNILNGLWISEFGVGEGKEGLNEGSLN